MADFSITVTNSVAVFGPEPTTKWNDFLWGTGKWAFGSNDTQVSIAKLISEDSTLSDSYLKNPTKVISESLSPSFETLSETINDDAGYYTVFDKDTNAENRAATSYTDVTDTVTTSHSAVSDPTTTWTEQ